MCKPCFTANIYVSIYIYMCDTYIVHFSRIAQIVYCNAARFVWKCKGVSYCFNDGGCHLLLRPRMMKFPRGNEARSACPQLDVDIEETKEEEKQDHWLRVTRCNQTKVLLKGV